MRFGPIDVEFILGILPFLFKGALITIELTVQAIVFGTFIGLFVALMKISRFKVLSILGGFYTWVIRGIPLLVQLFILYYGLPHIGIQLSPKAAAVMGLSICGGAYIAEIIRAGIQSIEKGQMEAALSLGMSYAQAMRRVILPQAYRRLLPPMGNEFIALMKDTSLVSVITMVELMRSGILLNTTYFRPMEIYITVGVVYLIMTTFFIYLISLLEKRLAISDGE
ncbi:amino acid ABC transporter permease [Desulfoscipio geothermicus]|uniref:Amino acid ABC transporter membrane protein, PAAT family (TC 3.A.1.3.-) n=1 Tax=Desulfoscipio geothermicus DSM 3669 TaxID=1121426 RepID=A0A1I6D825_9FIRM|nr:amino acid ABC transporter permease [Desulfoscipio geothermicus]SFR01573.1 amino acid ABC transporter membrane protein, PAAT family (TC 3.A.1.3.-) [Desulfoscipio geothermicus DSM 3669]